MSDGPIPCPHCRLPLPGALCNTPRVVACPHCDHRVHVAVFPAHFRTHRTGRSAEPVVEAGAASCFYHEGKKAVIPCDGCGRFLCALCDVELNQRHFCPACLNTARTRGDRLQLDPHRTVHDRAALTLSLVSVLLGPFALLTAPVAILFGVLAFRSPGSVVGRSRVKATAGIVLGLALIGLWIGLFLRANAS